MYALSCQEFARDVRRLPVDVQTNKMLLELFFVSADNALVQLVEDFERARATSVCEGKLADGANLSNCSIAPA
jgi:hypothetical protein